MTEDTSRGDHDTLMAACDSERYILLGVKEYHDNCTDNLFAAMQGLGLTPPECPSPLNLFMNIPWTPNGTLSFDPPTTKPGDYVTLRAELDCIVAMSACPQDLLPINGEPASRPRRIRGLGLSSGRSGRTRSKIMNLRQHRQDVFAELRRILAHREVADFLHDRHLDARDLARRCAACPRRCRRSRTRRSAGRAGRPWCRSS